MFEMGRVCRTTDEPLTLSHLFCRLRLRYAASLDAFPRHFIRALFRACRSLPPNRLPPLNSVSGDAFLFSLRSLITKKGTTLLWTMFAKGRQKFTAVRVLHLAAVFCLLY